MAGLGTDHFQQRGSAKRIEKFHQRDVTTSVPSKWIDDARVKTQQGERKQSE